MHLRWSIFIVPKYMRFVLICIVFLIHYLTIYSYAGPKEEAKDQLVKKGFSEEIINILNPLCQENLNRIIPADVTWYTTYDNDAKSVTVDFQTKGKAHKSITVVSLKEGGCLTVNNAIFMTIGTCKGEAESWIDTFKKLKVNLKIEEEDKHRIYLSAGGTLGIKVYLYQMGNLCMQVFRNVESIKYPAK